MLESDKPSLLRVVNLNTLDEYQTPYYISTSVMSEVNDLNHLPTQAQKVFWGIYYSNALNV